MMFIFLQPVLCSVNQCSAIITRHPYTILPHYFKPPFSVLLYYLYKSYQCVKYKSFLGLVHLWSLTDIVIFKVGTLIYRLHRRLVVLFVTLLFARRGRSFLPASRTSIFGYTARADHIIAWSRHQRSMRNYSRTCDRYGILLYISKYSCNIISTLKKSQYQITRFYV